MHALYFVRYIYCLFVVVFLLKKKTEKKSRSAVSRSVVPPFRVPSFHGLLTAFSHGLAAYLTRCIITVMGFLCSFQSIMKTDCSCNR